MNNIDWSKAPAEYPVWIQDLTGQKPDGSGWHREDHDDDGGRWTDVDGKFWPKSSEDRGSISVHRKPDQAWPGTGLPPVGTVCEYRVGEGPWYKCEIKYLMKQFNRTDVIANCETLEFEQILTSDNCSFRPIRTQAQIEAEERDAYVLDMTSHISFSDYKEARRICGELYDHGFRKQPKEDA